jgi:hypothetical protein
MTIRLRNKKKKKKKKKKERKKEKKVWPVCDHCVSWGTDKLETSRIPSAVQEWIDDFQDYWKRDCDSKGYCSHRSLSTRGTWWRIIICHTHMTKWKKNEFNVIFVLFLMWVCWIRFIILINTKMIFSFSHTNTFSWTFWISVFGTYSITRQSSFLK